MADNTEKRMAGEFEIIHALRIGDREIVLGENPAGVGDERYMCAFCQKGDLLASYTEVMVSGDYAIWDDTQDAIYVDGEVDIFTYVTENTFDSYLYQLVEGKQKFIGQIMTSKSPVRSAEDIDETALSYAEIKALCTGNPHIKEKMDLDIDVQRLKLLKANHLSQRYALEDQIIKVLPQKIVSFEQRIEGYTADMNRLKENTHPNEDGFSPMEVEGTVYTDKKAAGSAILAACKAMTSPDPVPLGQYRGFAMELSFESFTKEYRITLKGELSHATSLGTDIFGNIVRLDNVLGTMEERMISCRELLENTKVQLVNAQAEVEKPLPQEDELKKKSARLDELNILLNMDKRDWQNNLCK